MRLSFAFAGLGAVLAAQAPSSSLAEYAVKAGQGPTQKVVHYVKSNLDGSRRALISVHFETPLKLEVLKVEHDGQYLALVMAELDPESLTETRMRSYNRLEQGRPQLQMSLEPSAPAPRLVARLAKAELPVTPGHLPAHIYNFDLTGLNATLPHLKDPRKDFQVGLLDPDFEVLRTRFKPEGVQEGVFVYKGTATFRFVKEEVLEDVLCFRYEVGGAAFGHVKGTLWVNAQDRLIERFEHPLPDNPEWQSFRLSRVSARSMDAAAWEAFKAATVRRAMDLRDE